MCSIKVTLEHADGKHETFSRPSESGAGDGAKGDLHQLRTWMGEVQKDLNSALTVVVERERTADAGDGKLQNQKDSVDAADEEVDDDDDDDEEDDDEANGDVEPAVKKKKTV